MNAPDVKIKVKGSAAGQYLGFALQDVRLFYHLLTCPADADVGLEYVDDVSVHVGGKTICAEQCKSALSGNPISNWSPEFWKTLANWIENISAGVLNVNETRFQMYVVPVKKAGFAGTFSALSMDTEIDATIAQIRKQHDRLSKTPECENFYQKVLAAEATTLRALIRNFELLNTDQQPLAPIRNHLAATLRPEILEAAAKFGIGDAKRHIDEAIRGGAASVVNAAIFRKRFHAFISAHDSERFLYSLSDAPTDEIVKTTISSAPCFVRQLDLIAVGVEEKTRAASDFLRASVDRTRWAEAGYVFEGSFGEYDSALTRRHHNLRTEVRLSHAELSEAKQGQLLYARCCNSEQLALEGRVVPEYFLPGTLNQLSDRREIGWHPEFHKLLKED